MRQQQGFDPVQIAPLGQQEPGVGYYGTSGFSYTAKFGPTEGPFAIQQIPYNGGNDNRSLSTARVAWLSVVAPEDCEICR